MVSLNSLDLREIELEHLQKLNGSGYDISCSKCGYMYRELPEVCEQCGSEKFTSTKELIKKLEFSI